MSNNSKSRFYVSSGIETTAGVAVTLNKSFRPMTCKLEIMEEGSEDDVVTGYEASAGYTRERLRAGGPLSLPAHPDFVAWALKMLHGAAPTSALVSPSSTVYEHTFNAFAETPATFSAMKKMAAVSTYTEKFAGVALKSMTLSSSSKKAECALDLVGLGVYSKGDTEPVGVDPASEGYLVGVQTNLKIDGSSLAAGVLYSDWSVTIDAAVDVIDTGGSTDLAATRIDKTGLRKVAAECTLVATSRARLDDFIAQTERTYEFICTGPTIDAGNSLTSLVAIKLTRGRLVKSWPTEFGHGVFSEKLSIVGMIDTATGYQVINRVRNLVASY